MKKNGKIELLRFIISVIIVLFHSYTLSACKKRYIFHRGSMGVEFFFLLSGYLMAVTCAKKEKVPCDDLGKDTVAFLARKYQAVAFSLWFAQIIALVVYCISAPIKSADEFFQLIFGTISEGFLLRATGFSMVRVNGVTWYLSVMMIAMAILYPLCRKYFSMFTRIIAPVLGFIIIGSFYLVYGTQSNPDAVEGFLYRGLIRGIGEIALGAFLYNLVQYMKGLKLTKLQHICVSLTEFISYSLIFYFMTRTSVDYDTVMMYLFMIGIVCSFSEQGVAAELFNNKLCYWLGKYSLSLYLGHCFWRKFINVFWKGAGFKKQLLIYVILSFGTALFIQMASDFYQKKVKVRKR